MRQKNNTTILILVCLLTIFSSAFNILPAAYFQTDEASKSSDHPGGYIPFPAGKGLCISNGFKWGSCSSQSC